MMKCHEIPDTSSLGSGMTVMLRFIVLSCHSLARRRSVVGSLFFDFFGRGDSKYLVTQFWNDGSVEVNCSLPSFPRATEVRGRESVLVICFAG